MKLFNFTYLDELSVKGLYSQVYPLVEYELERKTTALEANVGGYVESAGLLQMITKLQANTEIKGDFTNSSEKKTVSTIEQQARILIELLDANDKGNLRTLLCRKHPLKNSEILYFDAPFLLTGLYNDMVWIDIDQFSDRYFEYTQYSFVLESGETKNASGYSRIEEDEYFRASSTSPFGAIMHLGGKHIRTGLRHLTHTLKPGKTFHFSVLGEVVRESERLYSIKPIAVHR